MKERVVTILLSLALAASFLSGCAKAPKQDTAETEEEPDEADMNMNMDMDMNMAAGGEETEESGDVREIYLDFMRGNRTLTTSYSPEGDGEYYGAIKPGEYTYPALKAAYESQDGHDTVTRYAFADLGGDGIEELALCFENTEPSFLNWTGIIHCEDGQLELVHSYEDGYRVSSVLYEAGFLEVGGSFGAGAYGTDYFAFTGKGSAEKLFTVNHFFGSFATQICYDLTPVETGYSGDESWGYEDYELEITEYVPAERTGEDVKISVEKYSADPEQRTKEEQFVKELIEMGAEEISPEDMVKLTDHEGFSGPAAEWQAWEEVCTVVKAVDFECVYPQPENYLEAVCVGEDDAESDYAQRVLITTNKPLTDVRVLTFSSCDYSQEGICLYTVGEIKKMEELTPDKPLVIHMIFVGDTPNQGISYKDENGVEKTLAIAMSGMDGSICLEEAQIR